MVCIIQNYRLVGFNVLVATFYIHLKHIIIFQIHKYYTVEY